MRYHMEKDHVERKRSLPIPFKEAFTPWPLSGENDHLRPGWPQPIHQKSQNV